jgi:hypothetical protein
MSDPDLDELAEELAEFDVPEKLDGRSPREERVIAGFEEFSDLLKRSRPATREDRDIFERLYAVRLDHYARTDCRTLLNPRSSGLACWCNESRRTLGHYDVDQLAAELASEQRDDITVCATSAAPTNAPPGRSPTQAVRGLRTFNRF